MAHNEHRMFEVREVFLQPGHRLHIQVVGRLVQQQVIGISIQSLCQHDTHLLLVVQFAHQHIVLVFLNAQAAQQGGRITLGIPTVQLGKLLLQFGHLHAVLVRKIFFGIEGFTLLHDVPQHRVAHHHRIHHRISIPLEVVLAKYRQAFARSQSYRPRCRLQLSGNRLEKSRLACTVGTDDTITIAAGKLQVDVVEQHPLTKLYRNIRNCNHELSLSCYY